MLDFEVKKKLPGDVFGFKSMHVFSQMHLVSPWAISRQETQMTKAPSQNPEGGALSNLPAFINNHFGNHVLPQEGPF